MESPASPPKRITRARAARTATSSTAASAAKAAKPTKSTATAASKAKATRAAATTSAPSASSDAAPAARKSTKRKTRDDDHEDESEVETAHKRPPPASRATTTTTRRPGRPKKIVDPEPEPAPRAKRGRPVKKPAIEPAKEEAPPVRSTRTRAKKTQAEEEVDEDADDLAPESIMKKRGRQTGTATSASAPTSQPVKKTVTFAEPDKENVIPAIGAKKTATTTAAQASKPTEAPAATGMRARPVRKPAGTGRTMRTTATTTRKKSTRESTDGDKAPMPLSPKKVSQLSVNRDRDVDSEDELAMDRTPARPFRQTPVRPQLSAKPVSKAHKDHTDDDEDEEAGAADLALPPTDSTVLLGSPIRRLPQSPFKNSMKSPAKRVEGLQLGLSAAAEALQSSATPFKASLLQSPAKRPPMPLKTSDLNSNPFSSREIAVSSPFKQSLLQSPAKRPFSPVKPRTELAEITGERSPAPTPVLLCSPSTAEEGEGAQQLQDTEPFGAMEDNQKKASSPAKPDFNGRMSTVLPREVDPALNRFITPADEPTEEDDCETVVLEQEQEQEQEANDYVENIEDSGEPMAIDEPDLQVESTEPGDISTTPPDSPPQAALDMFGLRQKDLIPFDTTYSEADDEHTRVMTPNAVSPAEDMRGSTMRPRTSGFGFTPLARRFDEWQARSPHKPKTPTAERPELAPESATQTQFFEDQMSALPSEEAKESPGDTDPLPAVPEIKDPVLEDISITEEDLDLAAEANEMSMMTPEHVESMLNLDGNDDSISEASQEYGDENAVPGQAGNGGLIPPVTPQRPIRREFHTVSKVPLKPADESTPVVQPSLKKRRHSISRLPVPRPTHNLSRSATVISYSPTKNGEVDAALEEAVEEESLLERSGSLPPPETPSKPQSWSQSEAPARTPRLDVHPTLLRGAVVFVDVHTMDGADASAIFIELLTQMGARCVTSWHWNPEDTDSSSKIGITHVVYKDGGKATMEKVRETDGLVQCVGVGWVLDCERANEWLDEAPYYIDTSLIPRGGVARRRTLMDPNALGDDSTPVPKSTARNAARECRTAPTTPAPANRRDSSLWMHSPDDFESSGDFDLNDLDFEVPAGHEGWYNTAPLTPVPKTPAPDAIHRFAMGIQPDTPMADDDEENIGIEEMLSREQLMQRTCPPKAQHMYEDMGAGILGLQRDESVARRLMDARRKSLAFAPKISSPLARSWKEWN